MPRAKYYKLGLRKGRKSRNIVAKTYTKNPSKTLKSLVTKAGGETTYITKIKKDLALNLGKKGLEKGYQLQGTGKTRILRY